jgi:hypothetical protein
MTATGASSLCQCDTPPPDVLLLVTPNFQQWVLEGPARPYHNVMLTVHVTAVCQQSQRLLLDTRDKASASRLCVSHQVTVLKLSHNSSGRKVVT